MLEAQRDAKQKEEARLLPLLGKVALFLIKTKPGFANDFPVDTPGVLTPEEMALLENSEQWQAILAAAPPPRTTMPAGTYDLPVSGRLSSGS